LRREVDSMPNRWTEPPSVIVFSGGTKSGSARGRKGGVCEIL